MALRRAPYGTWKSPITAEGITKDGMANTFVDVIVDRTTSKVFYLENRPSEQGRNVLVDLHFWGPEEVLGPGWNVRTSVHEYGGAPAVINRGIIFFSNFEDGRIYRSRIPRTYEPEPITPGETYRYAGIQQHPTYEGLLVAIQEDHTVDIPSQVINTLVVIDAGQKTVRCLLSGADFYAQPKFSPNGSKLAWIQWSHPQMPWDGTQLYVADISISKDNILTVSKPVHVAGVHGTITAQYPEWKNDDTLIYLSDESGFMNPWKYILSTATSSAVLRKPLPEDFGPPLWQLDLSPYAISGNKGFFTTIADGRSQQYLIDLENPPTSPPRRLIPNPYVTATHVRPSGLLRYAGDGILRPTIVFIGQQITGKPTIVRTLFFKEGLDYQVEALNATPSPAEGPDIPASFISIPQHLKLWKRPSGPPLYVVYYAPTNPAYSGSSIEGERPPCIVHAHGGPTGFHQQGLDWKIQYFTSRGWAWLSVNYDGSSGYGREYMERLDGKWGIVDVQDCILAPHLLAAEPYNLIDPKRLIIRGGSAGGFTTLAAISMASNLKVFAAATSISGVSDLKKLAESTHKFESRYLDRLLGGSAKEVPDVYRDRSPVNHADKIVTPLLILQGDMDKVVPKDQAEVIYNNIRKRGGVVEYKLYPGEGHGWRREETMRDALERELGFYERILGLKDRARM
ncbi:alpha/beta-hydrolase [Agrocybe pediades]|nr:alpha/beta-hydrolase [Agrocybe pediades]